MTKVRAVLIGLAMSLAVTAAPARAATPETAPETASAAAEQVQRQGAASSWDVLKRWKGGVVRGCRSEWDGTSFSATLQLVNRAERGRRGAKFGIRSEQFPDWADQEVAPVRPGEKVVLIDGSAQEPPRDIKLRAKVTTPKKRSGWSKVVRMDRLTIC